MDFWFGALLLLLLALPIARAIYRSTELFVLRVQDGRCRFVRGRMPQRLLDDLSQVLARTRSSGQLRAVQERGSAVWVAKGEFAPSTLQQLRNVLGTYPLAKIKAGGKPRL
jgi:hypothetical protein